MAEKPTYEELKQRVKELKKKAEKHKRAEEALRESDAKLSFLTDNMADIIWTTDLDFRNTYASPSIEKVLGFSPDERKRQSLEENVTPESLEVLLTLFADEFFLEKAKTEDQDRSVTVEVEFYKKDGSTIWLENKMKWIRDAQGTITGIHEVSRDISGRKRAEETLQQYKRAVEGSVDIMAAVDRDYNYLFANKAYLEHHQLNEEQVIGHYFGEVVGEHYFENDLKPYMDRCLDGKALHFETSYMYPDKGKCYMEVWYYPLRDEDGRVQGVVGIARDITERKRAEEEREELQKQLLQAQKIESVGRLAGGVAHDFNNMLSVILGHTELALSEVDPKEPIRADLQEILKAAKRSADVTSQLLAFARKQTISPKVLDLNETVERILKLLRRLIGEEIDLAWQPDTNLWPVKMDPAQVDQILANLCVNARDAIAGVGKVTLVTKNVVLDEAYCADHAECTPGEYVMLAVSDDGCGMGKETLLNVFDPFFTTKEVGRGTGLGLSTVYGIVLQNQGSINVYSEPGKGATFKIYLPRQGGEVEAGIGEAEDQAPQGHGETILIVEDEPSVLAVSKKILDMLGYIVLTAGGPGEAMDMARGYSGEIHLLMTDVVMPEMNGKDLAEEITTIRPKTKTLFMSGYTANAVAHRGILDKGVHFIQKPFMHYSLARKVKEVLEG